MIQLAVLVLAGFTSSVVSQSQPTGGVQVKFTSLGAINAATTYTWSVANSASPVQLNISSGETGATTITSTYTRTQGTPADLVTGGMLVSNNGSSTVTISNVDVAVDMGAAIGGVVVGAQCSSLLPASLAAGGTLVCSFEAQVAPGTHQVVAQVMYSQAGGNYSTARSPPATAAPTASDPTTSLGTCAYISNTFISIPSDSTLGPIPVPTQSTADKPADLSRGMLVCDSATKEFTANLGPFNSSACGSIQVINLARVSPVNGSQPPQATSTFLSVSAACAIASPIPQITFVPRNSGDSTGSNVTTNTQPTPGVASAVNSNASASSPLAMPVPAMLPGPAEGAPTPTPTPTPVPVDSPVTPPVDAPAAVPAAVPATAPTMTQASPSPDVNPGTASGGAQVQTSPAADSATNPASLATVGTRKILRFSAATAAPIRRMGRHVLAASVTASLQSFQVGKASQYEWKVRGSVSPGAMTVQAGQSVVANYQSEFVRVLQNETYEVKGRVQLFNPDTTSTASITNVTVSTSNFGAQTVVCGEGVTSVPPGASLSCPFTLTVVPGSGNLRVTGSALGGFIGTSRTYDTSKDAVAVSYGNCANVSDTFQDTPGLSIKSGTKAPKATAPIRTICETTTFNYALQFGPYSAFVCARGTLDVTNTLLVRPISGGQAPISTTSTVQVTPLCDTTIPMASESMTVAAADATATFIAQPTPVAENNRAIDQQAVVTANATLTVGGNRNSLAQAEQVRRQQQSQIAANNARLSIPAIVGDVSNGNIVTHYGWSLTTTPTPAGGAINFTANSTGDLQVAVAAVRSPATNGIQGSVQISNSNLLDSIQVHHCQVQLFLPNTSTPTNAPCNCPTDASGFTTITGLIADDEGFTTCSWELPGSWTGSAGSYLVASIMTADGRERAATQQLNVIQTSIVGRSSSMGECASIVCVHQDAGNALRPSIKQSPSQSVVCDGSETLAWMYALGPVNNCGSYTGSVNCLAVPANGNGQVFNSATAYTATATGC